MPPILIFRHIDCEGPGYLGQYLKQRRVPFRIIEVDRGAAIPSSIDAVRGLVFMGGPMSANDRRPWITATLALIRAAHARGLPVLGHCLGAQLIARALGATVTANQVKEIGWWPVRRCADGDWQGLPREFEAFHWHGETFSLPGRAAHLFESDACRYQGFQLGATLALQFHLEIQPDMVTEWTQRYAPDLHPRADAVQSETEIVHDLECRVAACHRIADAVYDRWLAPSA